jgi:uncharacterized protein
MEFEWDEAKRQSNIAKHGIDFARAQFIFDGRPLVTIPSRYLDEQRFVSTGIVEGRFLTVIWTIRDDKLRLVSARRSRNEEKREYRELYS